MLRIFLYRGSLEYRTRGVFSKREIFEKIEVQKFEKIQDPKFEKLTDTKFVKSVFKICQVEISQPQNSQSRFSKFVELKFCKLKIRKDGFQNLSLLPPLHPTEKTLDSWVGAENNLSHRLT